LGLDGHRFNFSNNWSLSSFLLGLVFDLLLPLIVRAASLILFNDCFSYSVFAFFTLLLDGDHRLLLI